MKTTEEIEMLAEQYADSNIPKGDTHSIDNEGLKETFVEIYTKCQQDIDKKCINTNIVFHEKKEFPHDIAVKVKGLEIAKLRARGSGWDLETLGIIHSFWMGGTVKQFTTLDKAKEETIKWVENWLSR